MCHFFAKVTKLAQGAKYVITVRPNNLYHLSVGLSERLTQILESV